MEGNLILSHVKAATSRKTDRILLVPEEIGHVAGKIQEVLGDCNPLGILNDDDEALSRQFYAGPDNLLIGRRGALIHLMSGGRNCLGLHAKKRVRGLGCSSMKRNTGSIGSIEREDR